jgi:SAM-dependent methyltransferase
VQESHLRTIDAYQNLKNINAQSHAIRAAVKLGVIQELRKGQRSLEQLSDLCHLKTEALRLVLEVLKSSGLIEQYGEDYALAQVGQVWPEQLSDLGDRYWEHLEHWMQSDETIPQNPTTSLDLQDYEIEHAADAWWSTPAAMDAAKALAMGDHRKSFKILDLYSGSGVFALVLLHHDPTSTATLVDRPERLKLARQHAAGMATPDAIEWLECDPTEVQPSPGQYDLVLISRQIHRLASEDLDKVLGLAHQALKPDGEVVLIDVFPGQSEGDLSRTVRELELALRTHGRPMLSPPKVEQVLKQHGFSEVQFAHLPATPKIFGLVLARKASK